MKYIDAERLRKVVEEKYNSNDNHGDRWDLGYDAACEQILDIIDTLQQEQPDFPTTDEEIERLLATHPKVEVPNKYKTPDWLWKKQEQSVVDCHELEEAAVQAHIELEEGEGLSTLNIFKAGAEWQYQKDRREFAKLKAKEWNDGYDDAVSQFVKIPYEPRDWFSSGDGDFICGASFDEAIPAKVELYYKEEDKQ